MAEFEVPNTLPGALTPRGRRRAFRLHYDDTGPSATSSVITGGDSNPGARTSAVAVVFLHILAMDSRMWSPQVRDLTAQGQRCVTLDFRGQGRSSAPRGGYDPDQLAADVTALLEHLRIDRAHLVGASMGGFVALRVALARPERVASLTLIGTTARREAPTDAVTNFALANILRVAGPRPLVQPVLRSAFGPHFLADPAHAGDRDLWADHFAHLRRLGTARAVRGVTHRRAVRGLEALDVPTRVLVGEHDTPRRHAAAAELATKIRGATATVVPGSGHAVPIEQPDVVTATVRAHLQHATHAL